MEDNELVKKATGETPEPGHNRYGKEARDRILQYVESALNTGQISFREHSIIEDRLNRSQPLGEKLLAKIGFSVNPTIVSRQLAVEQLKKSLEVGNRTN